MEILIGLLVSDTERQKKYREIIQRLLLHETARIDIQFYQSLSHLREAVFNGNERLDMLILQAAPQNFSFAQELRILDRACLILYPARDMTLVLKAFSSMPAAYIPAQNTGHTLGGEILRAVDFIKKSKGRITFETKSVIYQYALDEIDYFESQYRMVHIVKRNRKVDTITAKLDVVQRRLPPGFGRCHQSYLVNMGHIKSIDRTLREVHFHSGQSVPASKKLFTEFLESFRKYCNEGDGYDGLS